MPYDFCGIITPNLAASKNKETEDEDQRGQTICLGQGERLMTDRGNETLLQKGLGFAGSLVDDAFLMLPQILKPFTPARRIDPVQYRQEIQFYLDHGYVAHPESFFQVEDVSVADKILNQTPYQDGLRQIIAFESRYQTRNPMIAERFNRFVENQTAYLIRWAHGDRGRKTVLCLHGYMLGEPSQAERMFKVSTLYRMGLDVGLFITPFHWKRAPRSRMMRGIFLQPDDVGMTCECVGQAMHDLYQSIMVLKKMGASEVGLIGASLGGYHAGLFACLNDRIAFAALMVPAVLFIEKFSPQTVRYPFPVDKKMHDAMDQVWRLHSPLNFYPKIQKERVLIVASRSDKLCPFEHVQALCEKWDWPPHVFMTGGHWLVINPRERGRAWYRLLADTGFIEKKG